MQFILFLFHVDTVDTRNRKCIRLNGVNIDTVNTIIDVHVFCGCLGETKHSRALHILENNSTL